MQLFEQAKALGRAGRPREAVALIENAARAGDPEGNVILAHWHLYGSDRPRDPDAARRCFEAAAAKGEVQAVRMLAYLTAAGIGAPADPAAGRRMLETIVERDSDAAAQLRMLDAMPDEAIGAEAPRERLSDDPRIEIVRGLLSATECAYIMSRAEPELKPSTVFDPVQRRGVPDPIRISDGATFLPHDEDLVMQAIARRIAAASGTERSHGEALYVIRYRPGQEYRPHHDALPGLRNQRAWTAIAYLNDDYEGGATSFPAVGVSVRGRAGDLLAFCNVDERGEPHPKMGHAGEPVTSGIKWIATRWIRAAPHDPYDYG